MGERNLTVEVALFARRFERAEPVHILEWDDDELLSNADELRTLTLD